MSFLVFLVPALAGCGGGKSETSKRASTSAPSTSGITAAGTITLLASSHNEGPWSRTVAVRLGRGGVPVQWFACAERTSSPPVEPCTHANALSLPAHATLRLEQRPPGPALVRPDSPGWGLVATSETAELRVPLSDFVAGNKAGHFTYRVTLRDASGKLLETSNRIAVIWHR